MKVLDAEKTTLVHPRCFRGIHVAHPFSYLCCVFIFVCPTNLILSIFAGVMGL